MAFLPNSIFLQGQQHHPHEDQSAPKGGHRSLVVLAVHSLQA
jgi:hypothetical protein